MSRTKKQAYTGSKAVDSSCRSHGSCPACQNKRTHKNERRKAVQENTRFFRTLTDTPDPNKAKQSAEVADHIAAFLANGGKINPVGIKPAEPEVPRFNGKNHEDIGKTYQGGI